MTGKWNTTKMAAAEVELYVDYANATLNYLC